MSEFLKVTGDPADVIGSATLISGAAESLKADLPGLLSDISRLETDAVIGNDDFAHQFTRSYRQPTSAGSGSVSATDATKTAAGSIADTASKHGAAVISAMQDYLVTDGQGAADIGSTLDV